MKRKNKKQQEEAVILAHYLIRQLPTPQVMDRYTAAIQPNNFFTTAREKRIWEFCMAHPWTLGCLDAAYAWTSRYHPLRRKIFIMLAVLETEPAFHPHFLPQKRTRLYPVLIGFRLLISPLKYLMGKVLLCFL